MNDKQLQFVNREQAVILRELGFDWEVDYHFKDGAGDILIPHNPKDNYNSRPDEWGYFSAPTVALALKWIRNKLGIQKIYEAAEITLLDQHLKILKNQIK